MSDRAIFFFIAVSVLLLPVLTYPRDTPPPASWRQAIASKPQYTLGFAFVLILLPLLGHLSSNAFGLVILGMVLLPILTFPR